MFRYEIINLLTSKYKEKKYKKKDNIDDKRVGQTSESATFSYCTPSSYFFLN